MTYAHSRPKEIGQSTSSAAVSPAKTSALQARVSGSPVQGPVFGTKCTGSLARYDRDSCSWKTSQRCLDGGWQPYSATFPRSGMTRNGTLFLLQPLVRRTGESGSGLWPTPSATQAPITKDLHSFNGKYFTKGDGRKHQTDLLLAVIGRANIASTSLQSTDATLQTNVTAPGAKDSAPAMWGTPTAGCWKGSGKFGGKTHQHDLKYCNLRGQVLTPENGGQLNPTWVEWLMGFPLGWTDLEDSETQSSPKSSS